MKTLTEFINDLQKLDAKDVISEIVASNLTDKDIIEVMRTIAYNDTWKYEALKK